MTPAEIDALLAALDEHAKWSDMPICGSAAALIRDLVSQRDALETAAMQIAGVLTLRTAQRDTAEAERDAARAAQRGETP